jgi:hypothetical protein
MASCDGGVCVNIWGDVGVRFVDLMACLRLALRIVHRNELVLRTPSAPITSQNVHLTPSFFLCDHCPTMNLPRCVACAVQCLEVLGRLRSRVL